MKKSEKRSIIDLIATYALDFFTVLIILSIALSYSAVTLHSPIAFGDEGFYSSTGEWIAQHMEFPKYYPYIGTDYIKLPAARLPMGFINTAFFSALFGETGIKIMMPFFIALSALLVYFTFRGLRKQILGFFIALAIMCLPACVKYGVLNYPENQAIFYIIAAACFFLKGIENKDTKWFIVAGIMQAFACLSDVIGFFSLPAYMLWLLSERFKGFTKILPIFIIPLIFIVPWMIRNYALYDAPCIPALLPSEKCKDTFLKPVEKNIFRAKTHRPEISTGAGLFKFGIINFLLFGFGFIGIIAVVSAGAFAGFRDRLNLFFTLWLLIAIAIVLYLAMRNPRTEDLLRYSLFAIFPVAYFAGRFIESVFEKSKTSRFTLKILFTTSLVIPLSLFIIFVKGNMLAGIMIFITYLFFLPLTELAEGRKPMHSIYLALTIILVFAVLYSGIGELLNMYRVKHNLDPLVDACKWVREHTPENATITLVYAHPAEYNCKRRIFSIQGLPEGDAIRLWANESSYQLLKKWGFDYIMIEGFTMVPKSMYWREAEPLEFVFYLENSPHFEKVYDNTAKYGPNGIRIYKIK